MTDDELEQIRALGRAEGRRAAEIAPLSPALRDHVNNVMRDAVRAVNRRHEELRHDAQMARRPSDDQ